MLSPLRRDTRFTGTATLLKSSSTSPDYRPDKLHLFETCVATVPAIRIDNREIVEARWVTPAEALSLNLAPPS
jgi:hypothetical protein